MKQAVDKILQAQMPWRTFVITEEEYEEFKRHYIVSILKGETLGNAFCRHFRVNDYLIRLDDNNERVDKVIRQSYLKRQQVVQELYTDDK
jgi:hypothetical protein